MKLIGHSTMYYSNKNTFVSTKLHKRTEGQWKKHFKGLCLNILCCTEFLPGRRLQIWLQKWKENVITCIGKLTLHSIMCA